ncbi:LamB/YcsF family protein [Planctomycetes bacterium K23_9]|uniref:LamB/YcsF family protein n=1 Tax=Stieleria marina TaxID=1930275 RepID=A0A517NRU7_9BACT|nr:LamB/YcsF family protein [Planctomycetes bacterium K23_9]
MLINADVGESNAGSEIDLQLLQHVDLLNIALGAHAGDVDWNRQLCDLATAEGKKVSIHPGYPDREGFGRRQLDMPWTSLCRSLDQQRSVLPEITTCKFHGAIYNRSLTDVDFAGQLVKWCVSAGIVELIAPADSYIAVEARSCEIAVLREAFADRRYQFAQGQLTLVPRSEPGAVIDDPKLAIDQVAEIALRSRVQLADGLYYDIACDTICLHGDRATAVELAARMNQWRPRP